jgi:rSAM/selenodomain-associated transferase 2
MLVSIIIPTRNEEAIIATQVKRLRALSEYSCLATEIIVCDGASQDQTIDAAQAAGAKVLSCEANRGAQQNAGATRAHGDVLWFLHADAHPHPDCLLWLHDAVKNPRIISGNFRLNFDTSGWAPRLFESIARLQRTRGVYYGDSGIWVRREAFDLLGGFAPWPLFEDYDFAQRIEAFAQRHGKSTLCAPLPIFASTRRFQKWPGKVLCQWLWLQMQFKCGVTPEVLTQKYFRH